MAKKFYTIDPEQDHSGNHNGIKHILEAAGIGSGSEVDCRGVYEDFGPWHRGHLKLLAVQFSTGYRAERFMKRVRVVNGELNLTKMLEKCKEVEAVAARNSQKHREREQRSDEAELRKNAILAITAGLDTDFLTECLEIRPSLLRLNVKYNTSKEEQS